RASPSIPTMRSHSIIDPANATRRRVRGCSGRGHLPIILRLPGRGRSWATPASGAHTGRRPTRKGTRLMNHAIHSRRLGLGALLGAAIALAGCQGAGAFAQVSEKLNEIADGQTQILSRLAALEAKVAEAGKAAPAAPGQ